MACECPLDIKCLTSNAIPLGFPHHNITLSALKTSEMPIWSSEKTSQMKYARPSCLKGMVALAARATGGADARGLIIIGEQLAYFASTINLVSICNDLSSNIINKIEIRVVLGKVKAAAQWNFEVSTFKAHKAARMSYTSKA